MADDAWRMKGRWIKNCNCAYGCPCDFNARPTHGHCDGMVAMKTDEGHYHGTDLGGLGFAALVQWPGALHEGNGTGQIVIDERADERQRQALLTILSGKEQSEGTLFHILSLIVAKWREPAFKPIEFSFDLPRRRASVTIPGILETESEPIRNPVTGSEHRILVLMPEGFEHDRAEIASAARLKATGNIHFDYANSHSSLALVEHRPSGVVHA
jgi:hypothetical protein